jgi:hypothetical protein
MTKQELPTPPLSGHQEPTILHEPLYSVSKPIKIPTRQRRLLSPTHSPKNRPLSPELVFEMSPINSSSIDSFFPTDYSGYYSQLVHRSLKNRTAVSASTSRSPPFMYPFPRLSAHYHSRHVKQDHFVPSRSPESFPSSTIPLSRTLNPNQTNPKPHSIDQSPLQCLTSAFEDDFENSPEYQLQSCTLSASASSRGRSRYRSNVFDRSSALASPVSIYIHPRGRAPVSRPHGSPTQHVLQGEQQLCSEDLPHNDVEPISEKEINISDIRFENHLMRRTKDEKRVKVGRARVFSSINVSLDG